MRLPKKFLIIFLSIFITIQLTPVETKAQLDPRIKALGIMAGYGLVGGALLGTASLAFGTGGRSPFIGASLGLYAGLVFGGYVVASHAYRKHKQENPDPGGNYYPDTSGSPYEEEYDEGPFGGGNYHQSVFLPEYERQRAIKIRGPRINQARNNVPIYLNLLNVQF